jgi:signal transduction histidine kinase
MNKIPGILKRPEVIFAFVSVYAITAFGWWTFAHIRTADELYQSKINSLQLQCFQATLDVQEGIKDGVFNDTATIKEHFSQIYPKTEIVFGCCVNQFVVRPTEAALKLLEDKNIRTKWMYGLEGGVMLMLLFWGIVWIYQSLNSILGLNKRQNNFMLAITHELKTPIASAKLYMETLLKRRLDGAQQEQFIRNSISEINRLRDLVENILLASQLENSKFEIQKVESNISKLINQSVDNFALPRNLEKRIIKDIEENIFVETDEAALDAILTNLLSNATKYSPSDKPVEVCVKQANNYTLISVKDEGAGISDQDKKRVFEKFYRVGDESTRKTKGTGLGLFIVKNLINHIGAKLAVRDNVPNGTIFEIIIKQ